MSMDWETASANTDLSSISDLASSSSRSIEQNLLINKLNCSSPSSGANLDAGSVRYPQTSSTSTSSSRSGRQKRPEDLSINERQELLEKSHLNTPITLWTWVPRCFPPEIEIATQEAPRLMLRAFSPAFSNELRNAQTDGLVLPFSSKVDVICLVDWMLKCCNTEGSLPNIDLGDCSVHEWFDLWNAVTLLELRPAARQLSRQCEQDCKELCRTQLLEAWLACRKTDFREAQKVIPNELRKRLWDQYPGPDLMLNLWCLARDQGFTKSAIISFARCTRGNYLSNFSIDGFENFPESLQAAIKDAWYQEDQRRRRQRKHQKTRRATVGTKEEAMRQKQLEVQQETQLSVVKTAVEKENELCPKFVARPPLHSKLHRHGRLNSGAVSL